jgi:lysophospholipase L1-like esterase
VRPLKVHVLGSSAAVFVEPAHGNRDDGGTYGEQLAQHLTEAGVPTVTTHTGIWFGMVKLALPRYESEVRDRFPDVLVINFGMAELQSNALPYSVVRHVTTWHRTSRRGAGFYRHRLLPRAWKVLRAYQRWAGRLDKDVTFRQRPASFLADLRRIIDMARKECGCLVLLVDVDPAGPRVEHWLPGTTRRVALYNRLLQQLADEYDDDVRLVRASTTVDDVEGLVPDGLHRSPEGHRRTAAMLAEEVQKWLAQA